MKTGVGTSTMVFSTHPNVIGRWFKIKLERSQRGHQSPRKRLKVVNNFIKGINIKILLRNCIAAWFVSNLITEMGLSLIMAGVPKLFWHASYSGAKSI